MVALATLQGINKGLNQVQSQISTGKAVASAKDNAAVWAISKVMESDVAGFEGIKSSLALGKSTVAVGGSAAEGVTEMLGQIKGKIIAAQEDNVDRTKLQEEVASLKEQIGGIVGAAQFNGSNLLKNDTADGEASVEVLASLNRQADGAVQTSTIEVSKVDLGSGASKVNAGLTYADAATAVATFTADSTENIQIADANVSAATAFKLDLSELGGTGSAEYVARKGDTGADVAKALVATAKYELAKQDVDASTQFEITAKGNNIAVTNNTGADGAITASALQSVASTATDKNTIGGGMELLGKIDVSTKDGARAALVAIEHLTQTAVGAAASFGTSSKRMEIQEDFVSKLQGAMKTGIGSMVDTNMEEASAKLQALQVQQQLGMQALSIANRAPQQLLSLFR